MEQADVSFDSRFSWTRDHLLCELRGRSSDHCTSVCNKLHSTERLVGRPVGSHHPLRTGAPQPQRLDEGGSVVLRSNRRRSFREVSVLPALLLLFAVSGVLLVGAMPAAAADTCKPATPLPQSKCVKDSQCCAGLVCQ